MLACSVFGDQILGTGMTASTAKMLDCFNGDYPDPNCVNATEDCESVALLICPHVQFTGCNSLPSSLSKIDDMLDSDNYQLGYNYPQT